MTHMVQRIRQSAGRVHISSRYPAWLLICIAATSWSCSPSATDVMTHWYKGNLHTHSLWSDGVDLPEMVVDWYRQNEYDFIALSDHNTLAEGEVWTKPGALRADVFDKYTERFGSDWVEYRVEAGDTLVRLKTLTEYRTLFEEDGLFLIVQAEEITDRFESSPIHVNATNLVKMIPPQGGSSVVDVMQRNVDAVIEQREATGRPMIPHINHPNFGWAITAEDIAAVEHERFFEVYNGHPATNSDGDSTRAGTDEMWDHILIDRLGRGSDVIYGIAVDDAHHYHGWAPNLANPGRGWIHVRSPELSADSLIAAMERGDFYASTGVILKDVRVTPSTIEIDIATEDGVAYRTEFVGTRRLHSADVDSLSGTGAATTTEFARILGSAEGGTATYTFAGDELFVRARILSDRLKANGYRQGEMERAWTQPVVPSWQGQ